MTIEEARAGLQAKAYARGNMKKSGPHEWKNGRIVDLKGSTVTLLLGNGSQRDFNVADVRFDNSRNYGKVPPRPTDAETAADDEFVIFDGQQFTGYAGGAVGWTKDYEKWHVFRSSDEAVGVEKRLRDNGIHGLKVLPLYSAIERMEQHDQAKPEAPVLSTTKLGQMLGNGGLPNSKALAGTLSEFQQFNAQDEVDDRDNFNDRQLLARLEAEAAKTANLIEGAKRRIKEREERMQSRKIELAGLTAKLLAILQA